MAVIAIEGLVAVLVFLFEGFEVAFSRVGEPILDLFEGDTLLVAHACQSLGKGALFLGCRGRGCRCGRGTTF